MRLVNLRNVTCYTDQNFKENALVGALNLLTLEKRLKLSYKTSINLEDQDVDFAFPDFDLALFEWERSWCRNWIVTFPWKKIWSVFENFKADHAWRREWTGRNSKGFPQKINEPILRQWQQTYLEKLLCLMQCFFFYKDQRRNHRNDFEKDTVPGFQSTPALH